MALHIAAIASASFGLAALVRSKRDTGMPNMYSFHSWLGVTIFAAYIVQVRFLEEPRGILKRYKNSRGGLREK